MRVLVVGSANADLVTRVPRCPRPGETLLGSGFFTEAGGKGANQAVSAARLGADTAFLGCVGNDALGTMLEASLREAHVDVTGLQRSEDHPSGTAVIVVAEDGENAIVVTPGANGAVTPALIEAHESLFAQADAVITQFEIPLETVAAALRIARKHNCMTVLDCGAATAEAREVLAHATIVSPNETETATLTGLNVSQLEDAQTAAAALRDLGAKEVVLKLGAQGAFYLGQQGSHYAPAFEVDVVDTTAAGDAFTAALTVQWPKGNFEDALTWANAAGAAACTRQGAQPAMPTAAEVEKLAKQGALREPV